MTQKRKFPTLFLLICLLGFPQISETIYTPSLPDLAHGLNIKMDLAELTLSIYFAGFAFGVLTFGVLADWMGRRRSMILGIVIYILGSLGCSFSSSISALLFYRFFQAFGAAAGSVVTQTMLRDLYTGPERQRVFSIVSGALAFSPAMGPVIGGLINQLFHWRANFHALVLMGIILGFWSFFRLYETSGGPTQGKKLGTVEFLSLCKEMSRDSALLRNTVLVGACNGILFSYYAEAPFIFIELLELKPVQYGFLGLVIATSFFYASFLSIRLNRRLSIQNTITTGALISCLGAFLLSLTCWFITPSTHHISILLWASLMISLIFVFLGIGIIIPNCLSQALQKYKDHSGTAGSLFGFTYYWLIAGFTALMGILHNNTALAMPLYFCVLTGGMCILGASAQKSVT